MWNMNNVKAVVALKRQQILNKVENDRFGVWLAKEWYRLIRPYTPYRDGLLELAVSFAPFEFTYWQPYAHYVYNGEAYVDPDYDVCGFTNDGGETFFSRKYVKKIPGGFDLNYRTDMNPYATDHWDQKAAKAGQKDKLGRAATKYLNRKG